MRTHKKGRQKIKKEGKNKLKKEGGAPYKVNENGRKKQGGLVRLSRSLKKKCKVNKRYGKIKWGEGKNRKRAEQQNQLVSPGLRV